MLNVNITIQADAEGAFTRTEQEVLNALAGSRAKTTQVGEVKVVETVPVAKAPAPVEEAPAKPKRTRRTKAEIEAEKAAKEAEEIAQQEAHEAPEEAHEAPEEAHEAPEEEPKTLREELEEEDEVSPETLRKDVVKLASALVSNGQAGDVRKALTNIGAKKVSEVKDKDLQALKSSLEDFNVN